MEKIPEKNIKESNNDEKKITKEFDVEIKDDFIDNNENIFNSFLFNEKNSESLSSKKRNRNEKFFSFSELDDFEDFNKFNNQNIEKPKKNIKSKIPDKNGKKNTENTSESGYGEMIYMEPGVNQMMSPITSGRQSINNPRINNNLINSSPPENSNFERKKNSKNVDNQKRENSNEKNIDNINNSIQYNNETNRIRRK